jgi:cellulose synthase/poly-beta-1,6-N-acetylglucosamine synthase-like glycosyltransferase
MVLVNLVFAIVALGLLVPSAVLFVECLSALLPNPVKKEKKDRLTKIAVLVPAHDEASNIENTIETLLPQLKAQDRLVVIADNCTDETAAIARQCGAIVIERQNSRQRGKGYNREEVSIKFDASFRYSRHNTDFSWLSRSFRSH